MEFVFEVLLEIILEGTVAVIQYFFNKFYKHKLSERNAKLISVLLTTILIIGALAIIFLIAWRMT